MTTQFGIHLKVKDINISWTFYRAFGLKPVFAYGDEGVPRILRPYSEKTS